MNTTARTGLSLVDGADGKEKNRAAELLQQRADPARSTRHGLASAAK
jgi:hypothetical protein